MRLPIVSVLLVSVALVACSSSAKPKASTPPSTSASTVTVAGTVTLVNGTSVRAADPAGSLCYTSGNSPIFPSASPFDDVKGGAQVVVTDASGKTLGIGTLGSGVTTRAADPNGDHPDCEFHFTVSGVPDGQSFYGVKVGAHSKQVAGSSIATAAVTFP